MSFPNVFNFGRTHAPAPPAGGGGGRTEVVRVQNALRRILSFTGHTIDDVVNDPLAKAKVRGFYKLHKWVERGNETTELERQWNPLR